MKLIDKEQAYQVLSDYYHHAVPSQHKALSEALDRVPTVDAVPVHIIQDRIDSLQELKEYEAEANGGYTGQVHTEVYALRALINYWKAEQSDKGL